MPSPLVRWVSVNRGKHPPSSLLSRNTCSYSRQISISFTNSATCSTLHVRMVGSWSGWGEAALALDVLPGEIDPGETDPQLMFSPLSPSFSSFTRFSVRSRGSSRGRFCVTVVGGVVGDLSWLGGRKGLNPVRPGRAKPGKPWGKPRKGKMSGLIGATWGGDEPADVGVKYSLLLYLAARERMKSL